MADETIMEIGAVSFVQQQLPQYEKLPMYDNVFVTSIGRGGSRIFFRRGCTRLLLYFNTNKPHSFFFGRTGQLYKKTAGHLGGGGCAPPAPSP